MKRILNTMTQTEVMHSDNETEFVTAVLQGFGNLFWGVVFLSK